MHTLEQLKSGALAGLRHVKLSCGLTEFPVELYALADDLEVLELSGNALDSLPADLPRLHKLRVLFCAGNRFTELPPVLGQCPQLSMVVFKSNQITRVSADALPPNLRWLTLTDNRIATLPEGIGACSRLQKLMLAGNRLSTLPPSLADCHALELVRVSANRLTELPGWLLTLPRLSWLAFGGNPLGDALETSALADNQAELPALPWSSLQLQDVLGEGASGVIHQAQMARHGATRAVALKLFKGAMTSDGLPRSELAACLRAGQHRNLIPVLGKVEGHPQGAMGFVMALMNKAFQSLAAPPSLESCTRDVYPQAVRFEFETALRIAAGIAAVAGHLHQRGVMHGDLYAHNTLHDEQGRAVLGDFGAASLYNPAHVALGQQLQRLEARAFGCLLEELLQRADIPAQHHTLARELAVLQRRCLGEVPHERPLFREIEATLTRALAAVEGAPAPG